MYKVNRSYSDIMSELGSIKDKTTDHKVIVVADALRWGYGSARTCFLLESYLYHAPDLDSIIKSIAKKWDGNDYLNGALHVAQRYFHKTYEGG